MTKTNVKTKLLLAFILAISLGGFCLQAHGAAPEKPNILFIFGDDCGIDSFNCYGSDHARGMTPNIDALAKSGTRYERCYATPLCGPSRCCIMTGRHGFRSGGLTNQTSGNAKFTEEPSLAKILKSAGYATAMAGKWRQMSDSPGDWGFDEYITDPTAGGWYWKDNYTKNGKEVKLAKEEYIPDHCTDFAVDFIRRHKDGPFYFYLSSHLIHGPILKTPDTKEGASAAQFYDDNIKYLDKTVEKMVAEIDRLGIREKTLILFTTDNGTATVGYQPEHDPKKDVGHMGGRAVNGHKGQLLEGGSRVPLIASWKGTLQPGQVSNELHDFTDLLPTFAELAGAKLPSGVKFDGRSFAPQLKGEKGTPREWIFVQLGAGWYVRDDRWKMNQKGELFNMKDAPFVEAPIAADSSDTDAQAARKRLSTILADFNPAGGKTVPEGADEKTKAERKAKKAAQKAAQKAASKTQ